MKKTGIPIVEDKVISETVEILKEEMAALSVKKKLSKTDKLMKEYMRTFINNSNPYNYLLMRCGRADEMVRKEEIE